MALQQAKSHRTAQSINDKIDISAGINLPPVDCASQRFSSHLSPSLGELSQECLARLGIDLGLGNQSDECWTGHRARLQVKHGLGNLSEGL